MERKAQHSLVEQAVQWRKVTWEEELSIPQSLWLKVNVMKTPNKT